MFDVSVVEKGATQRVAQLKFSKNDSSDAAIHLAFRSPDGKKLDHIFNAHYGKSFCLSYVYVYSCPFFILRSCMSLFLLWGR